MFWEHPQWAEFDGHSMSLLAFCVSGALFSLILVCLLNFPRTTGLMGKTIQTAALFVFGLLSAFYLSVVPRAAAVTAFLDNEARGAAFLLFAFGAGLEAAELSKGLAGEHGRLNTAALSAACLCGAAAMLDNLAVTAFLLPFIPFRRLYAIIKVSANEEEIALAYRSEALNDQIKDKALELKTLKETAEAEYNRENPEFWLLPNLSDDVVAAQLRG